MEIGWRLGEIKAAKANPKNEKRAIRGATRFNMGDELSFIISDLQTT